MSSDTVQNIKDRLSIVEVVESYITIEKAGKNFKARSPFSSDKTASFYVSPDQNLYHCFSTGKGGDIFTFVQEMEGVDFKGALKILADKAGIELTYQPQENKGERDRLFRILEVTALFYSKIFEKNKEAQDYIKKRGLTDETIQEWKIGFAPAGWRSLFTFFSNKKVKAEELIKAGLIKKGDSGNYYDRFRGRIMFPISDPSGRVVGFTGRILNKEKDEAKYINSPETELFNKSNILFGYDKAKTGIRKNDFSILVEGQMDVLMAHQAGYTNTVASSGTALTDYQLDLLKRLSSRLVIALDGDGAGLRASEKAWKMALTKGIDVKVALVPTGSDPADLIKEDISKWKEVIKNSKHIIDVLMDLIEQAEPDSRKRSQRIHTEIVPYIRSIDNSLEQSHFVDMVSSRFDIRSEALWEEVKKKKESSENNFVPKQEMEVTKKEDQTISEKLLGIYLWQSCVDEKWIDVDNMKEEISVCIPVFEEKIEKIKTNNPGLLFSLELHYSSKEQLEQEVKDLIHHLKLQAKKEKWNLLKQTLKEAELSGDYEAQEKIMGDITKLSQEIALH